MIVCNSQIEVIGGKMPDIIDEFISDVCEAIGHKTVPSNAKFVISHIDKTVSLELSMHKKQSYKVEMTFDFVVKGGFNFLGAVRSFCLGMPNIDEVEL